MDVSKYSTPHQRAEHTVSYSQDKPLGHGENLQALIRGIKQWLPDIPGSVGDIADLAYEGARRVLQGQKQRTGVPLGAGAAARRFVSRAEPRTQTELTDPDAPLLEEAVRFLNPAMLNPKQALKLGALGMASGAAPGVSTAIIKPRGGSWFTGPGSELESSLKYLMKGSQDNFKTLLEKGLMTPESVQERPEFHLNKWIQGPLKKYMQRDMATEADPIRRLTELDQPVSHMPLEEVLREGNGAIGLLPQANNNRREAGMSQVGKNDYAKAWENIADASVYPQSRTEAQVALPSEHPMMAKWVFNLPPEEKIYDLGSSSYVDILGFPHLTDELYNALRPDSDLPEHLRLLPEQLQQMGIEKAVRHVADINQYRADFKAAADAEMLKGPGVIPVREYAENNPKGLRWVEIGKSLPKATSIQGSKEEDELLKKAIQKQLKYEGDSMGHCVGGYCEDVLEGKSRIFSLRDAKGSPHVTIEVEPVRRTPDDWMDFAIRNMPEEELVPIRESFKGPSHAEQLAGMKEAIIKRPDFQEWMQEPKFRLAQSKGKQNAKPKSEYLPFVQDFIRNSPLGRWTAFDENPEFTGLSWEELQRLTGKPGYAQGGLVGKQEFNGAVGYILEQ